MGTQLVLNPVASPRVHERPLADRPTSLAGLRIGLLDNQKANAGLLLDGVGAALTERWPDVTIVRERKVATSPSPEAVMGRLEECDAVILAIAD